jgi:cytochrome c553
VLGSSTPSNNGVDEVMPTPAVDKAGDVAVRTEPPPPSAPAAVTPIPATSAVAHSGDPSAGKTKSAACAGCHGMDGRGTSTLFPNLNGQKPDYLARQLTAFRDGTRQDPTMAPMVQALTDQDIADLAAFYATLK